jgi:hypothetical protein
VISLGVLGVSLDVHARLQRVPPDRVNWLCAWPMTTFSCAPLNRRDELRNNFDLIDKPPDKMVRVNEGDAAQAD